MESPIQNYIAQLLKIDIENVIADDEIIKEILRRRLTKKERKLLFALCENKEREQALKTTGINALQYDHIYENLHKKLSHPKIRNDIVFML